MIKSSDKKSECCSCRAPFVQRWPGMKYCRTCFAYMRSLAAIKELDRALFEAQK